MAASKPFAFWAASPIPQFTTIFSSFGTCHLHSTQQIIRLSMQTQDGSTWKKNHQSLDSCQRSQIQTNQGYNPVKIHKNIDESMNHYPLENHFTWWMLV